MSYATTDELFRLTRITAPTPEQLAAGQRALDAASLEVDRWIGLADLSGTAVNVPPLTSEEIDLATEVALERAVEHWQQGQSPFGIFGSGSDMPIVTTPNSWRRHSLKLRPLKRSFGVA